MNCTRSQAAGLAPAAGTTGTTERTTRIKAELLVFSYGRNTVGEAGDYSPDEVKVKG